MTVNNETRIAWAEDALDVFIPETFCSRSRASLEDDGPEGDLPDAVSDLICNLLHYASGQGIDTSKIMKQAVSNFEFEQSNPED